MGKIGFLQNKSIDLASVISETDTAQNRDIVITRVGGEEGYTAAEFSVVDDTENLEPNGMTVENLTSGDLLDKHNNMRYRPEILDPYLGTSRFGIIDNVDTTNHKGKDEYWAMHEFQSANEIGAGGADPYYRLHWDGEVLMYFYELTGYALYVKLRDEATKTWGASALVASAVNTLYINSNTYYTRMAADPVTIPNLGTIVFLFELNDSRKDTTGTMYLTKDHGATWSKFGNFPVDPFYGDVIRPVETPAANRYLSVLKGIYYNNKIILGMILQGTDSDTPTFQEHIGYGTQNTGSNPDSFSYTTDYKIVPGSISIRVNGNGFAGSGTGVATDDGAGNITGTDIVGTVDYDTKEIAFAEVGAADPIQEFDAVSIDYIATGGMKASRILNIMYSDDLGKNWVTVPYEFISASYQGPLPLQEAYLLGDLDSTSEYYHCLPRNFALGYDIHSDKVVLAFRGAGLIDADDTLIESWKYVNNVYFYYNKADDLFEWESSRVTGKSHKVLDNFNRDRLLEKYYVFDYPGAAGAPSNWYIEGGFLNQTSNIFGPSYVSGQSKGGTQLIYKDSDPTVNRTVGVHMKMLSADDDDSGFGFCRQDEDNFYAVDVDFTNSSTLKGTVDVNLKKVVGGTESTLASSTNIPWPKNTFGEISVLFDQDDRINVCVNGLLQISTSDNTFRIGQFFLFCNGQEETELGHTLFDDVGFHNNRSMMCLPGFGYTNETGWFNETFGQVGNELDIDIDQFGNAWISGDVMCLNFDTDTGVSYHTAGIFLQSFRLKKDIQRVEGKFLAKDKYVVKFNDSEDYENSSGFFFNPQEFGIATTNYGTNHGTGVSTTRVRAFLNSFIWKKDGPVFGILRNATDNTQYRHSLFERSDFSDISVFSNFVSTYSHVSSLDGDPTECGWQLSSPFNFTAVDYSYIRLDDDNAGYFQQSYDPVAGTISANGNETMGAILQDYLKRGSLFYFKTRAYQSNVAGGDRVIFETSIPYIEHATGTPLREIRYRLRFVEETSPGADDAVLQQEYYNGSTWTIMTTIDYSIAIDFTKWLDVMVAFTNPIEDATYLRVYLFVKEEGSTTWKMIPKTANKYYNIFGYVPVGNPESLVKFGCFSSTAGTTPSRQEFRFCGYCDSCPIDYSTYITRGVPIESGEYGYASKGIIFSVSGGNSVKGDSWLITENTGRTYPASNILDRKSVRWVTDNDTTDKSAVIDLSHIMEYDTVVLLDVNCQKILFEANDEDVWTSPSVTYEFDMTIHTDLLFEKYAGVDNVVKLLNAPVYVKDSLVGKLIRFKSSIDKVFRIIGNNNNNLTFEGVGGAVATGVGYLDILETDIAVRFNTRFRNRYIRVTMETDSLTNPTPDGYFYLGQFAAGVFDLFTANPEYPVVTDLNPNVIVTNISGGSKRLKVDGPVTKSKSLSFNAISMAEDGFAERLLYLFRNNDGYRTMFYVENIEEYDYTYLTVLSGTYTFNVLPCLPDNKFSTTLKPGTLTDIQLKLNEVI